MNKITEAINYQIEKEKEVVTDDISDGYHTFWELYKHRIHNFIALCRTKVELEIRKKETAEICETEYRRWFGVLKSKLHYDGSEFKGWFLMQLETPYWQISYHLPNKYWDICKFAETSDKANKWDWHTADDVLERLLKI